MSTLAYVERNGKLLFTDGPCPPNMLPIIRHKDARDICESKCRRSYPDQHGIVHLLVPGVPEAESEDDALAAVTAFRDWVNASLGRRAERRRK